jgi:hypothetical protein
MSAFVLILAAVMARGGESKAGPAEGNPSLDLRGSWEGTFQSAGASCRIGAHDGVIWTDYFPEDAIRIVIEGEGKVSLFNGGGRLRGIFKWEGDQLVICTSAIGPRPRSFQCVRERAQAIWTLQRIKPDK